MRHISQLKEVVATWRNLGKSVADLEVLVDLSVSEGDRSLEEEIPAEVEKIERSLEELEFELQLGGEYDRRGAC
jgi:peptide chain release factor 2